MSNAKSDAAILVDGRAVPVRIVRSARARNFRLTLESGGESLRLSLPARTSLKRALSWAQGHEGWVRAQVARTPERLRLAPGVTFSLEGRDVRIEWAATFPRTVQLAGDALHVGGAEESVGARVLRWLKQHARHTLETETRALAQRAGLHVESVGIGDPRTRWGSCTTAGVIRYSWRLILAPPDVRRATIAHEVAHLVHMDHSPAFHAEHARLLGCDPRPARQWLKSHGAALHRISA